MKGIKNVKQLVVLIAVVSISIFGILSVTRTDYEYEAWFEYDSGNTIEHTFDEDECVFIRTHTYSDYPEYNNSETYYCVSVVKDEHTTTYYFTNGSRTFKLRYNSLTDEWRYSD